MADKMAVMSGGVLQQYDSPAEVFARPRNTFVASFVGSPAMSLLPLSLSSENGNAVLTSPDGWTLPINAGNARRAARASSPKVVLGARHSTIKVHKSAVPGAVAGKVYTVEPTGDITFAQIYLGTQIVVASLPPQVPIAADEPVWVEFDQDKLHLFDGETQQALPVD